MISLAGTPNPVIQSFATGGDSPTTGFAGDFTNDGFTDLVVGNNGDGHVALLLGGAGGLSLTQTLSSAEVPNPTGLSFAGVSAGELSFYVSTAGREAATELAFNLEGGAGVEGGSSSEAVGPTGEFGSVVAGGLSLGAIAPTGALSTESTLSQATTGSVQQVSQLLSFSGTTLDLAATLLTVSVLPGNFEVEPGGGALASVGTTGFGQPVVVAGTTGGSSGPDDQPGEETGTDEAGPAGTVETIPAWERVSIGLERAWERARAAVVELESALPAAATPPAPPAKPSRSGRVIPPPARTGTDAGTESRAEPAADAGAIVPGVESTIAAIDAALEDRETRPTGSAGREQRVVGQQPARARALVTIAASVATAGAAWGWRTGSSRARRRLTSMGLR